MKKNTKWIIENKINYEKIFENREEKKLDFVIESLIENRNLSLDTNFDFNPFDLKDTAWYASVRSVPWLTSSRR